ncbi:MAG: hypothetical protein ILO68_06180 [Clostridia bacterium]|nr:hypothetical protein [Clostridia bacterium]
MRRFKSGRRAASAFACALVLSLLLSACGGEIPYYHQESSRSAFSDDFSDPVPSFVFGENGFYDTVNDIEYVRMDGVSPKGRGSLFASGKTADGTEKTFYEIPDEHPTYFLCDEAGTVYKHTRMPMMSVPGDESFDEQYPGLEAAPSA